MKLVSKNINKLCLPGSELITFRKSNIFSPLEIEGLQLYVNKNLGVNTKLAADFNGINQYLSSASADFVKTTQDFTFGGLFKWDNNSPNQFCIGKHNATGNQRGYALDNGTGNQIRLVVSSNGTLTTNVISSVPMVVNNWYFISGVVDNTNQIVRLKVNSAVSNSTSHIGGIHNTTANFQLAEASGIFMNGKADACFFYDYALSDVMLDSIYNSGNGTAYLDLTAPQLAGLVSWWELNKTSGTREDAHGTNDLTDHNSVGYAVGKVQEPAQIGDPVALWLDQSTNLYAFEQSVLIKEPLLTVNGVKFDNTDDALKLTIANAFIADSIGIIFFWGTYQSAVQNIILSSADQASIDQFFDIRINASGNVQISARVSAGNQMTLVGNTALSNGQKYYGYAKTNGSVWTASINGVSQTISSIGTLPNNGLSFSGIPNRDNLVFGALVRSVDTYSGAEIGGTAYSNANLSSATISNMATWMAQQ